MAIEQLEMTTGLNKVDYAINLLREWEPPEGYFLAFSGGKDSIVLYDIAIKSGVKFDAHYSVSPIDPPPLFSFIKSCYPNVTWDYHARGFWKLVQLKGLPLRRSRWCCQIIKESGGNGRIVLTGIRSSESTKRKTYNYIRSYIRGKHKSVLISPILNFTEYDVWQYIHKYDLKYSELYNLGFKRLGCVLCPFSREIELEEKYFPEIVRLWKLACEKLVIKEHEKGYYNFKNGEDKYQWWISR